MPSISSCSSESRFLGVVSPAKGRGGVWVCGVPCARRAQDMPRHADRRRRSEAAMVLTCAVRDHGGEARRLWCCLAREPWSSMW